jgi:hypothetical protein
VNKEPILPINNTPQGGRRRLTYSQTLVTNSGSALYTDLEARFQLDIPSCRLHTKVSVGYRPFNAEETPFAQSGPLAWLWRLDEWARTERGLLVPGNNIFASRAVPSSWEAITLSDQWRGIVTVPADDTELALDGDLLVVATWEPAAGADIDDRELAQLFQACHLRVTKALQVSTGA